MTEASDLGILLQLESSALDAASLTALRFTIVNETHALKPYRQAAMFELDGERFRLTAASGLVSVSNDSPFAVWLTQFAQRFPRDGAMYRLDFADASPADASGWAEWLPEHLLLGPLRDRQGQVQAMVMYAAEQPWDDHTTELIARLHATYAYCFAAMQHTAQRRWGGIRGLFTKSNRWRIAAAVLLCLFIPVRQSVLAPAEVIALNAVTVAAPQDGVVGSFAVTPNARVKKGEVLFSLDDSALLNRLAVARKALEIAQADAHTAQQRAFDDLKSKGELAVVMGRVREKEAELVAVETQAQRVDVRAESDGIAIFADTNDWLGRPVITGERVMQIAQPEDGGILVWLAVADAINLQMDAPVRLFLHTEPLSPRKGRLIEASYQASLSPEGVASYKLRAQFDSESPPPRIGLRGTARISGDKVLLGYYLFRRPIAYVREWTGW